MDQLKPYLTWNNLFYLVMFLVGATAIRMITTSNSAVITQTADVALTQTIACKAGNTAFKPSLVNPGEYQVAPQGGNIVKVYKTQTQAFCVDSASVKIKETVAKSLGDPSNQGQINGASGNFVQFDATVEAAKIGAQLPQNNPVLIRIGGMLKAGDWPMLLRFAVFTLIVLAIVQRTVAEAESHGKNTAGITQWAAFGLTCVVNPMALLFVDQINSLIKENPATWAMIKLSEKETIYFTGTPTYAIFLLLYVVVFGVIVYLEIKDSQGVEYYKSRAEQLLLTPGQKDHPETAVRAGWKIVGDTQGAQELTGDEKTAEHTHFVNVAQIGLRFDASRVLSLVAIQILSLVVWGVFGGAVFSSIPTLENGITVSFVLGVILSASYLIGGAFEAYYQLHGRQTTQFWLATIVTSVVGAVTVPIAVPALIHQYARGLKPSVFDELSDAMAEAPTSLAWMTFGLLVVFGSSAMLWPLNQLLGIPGQTVIPKIWDVFWAAVRGV